MNIQKTNEKNELIYEPLKIDGFILRTIEEDIQYEELEKTGRFNKKNKKK